MKIIKTVFTLLTAFIVISLAGCGTMSSGPGSIATIKVHTGTEGLEFSFMEQSPPGEVYVGDRFPLTLEFHNKGAYDIKKGVFVIGAESDYITVPSEYKDKPVRFDLFGRSLYDPIGGMDRKTIILTSRYLDPQSETHTTTIAVTACYPYKTEATVQVCIDTDIYNKRQTEKVCSGDTLSLGTMQKETQKVVPNGQGAPIAISKIEQKMMMHNESDELVVPRFLIYVKNMRNGLPVNIDGYDRACESTGLSMKSWNVVSAKVYLSDRSIQLDCTPKLDYNSADKTGHIKLEKQEDFIRCTLPEGIPTTFGAYTSPLMIDLEYGYTFTISKNVLIRKQV